MSADRVRIQRVLQDLRADYFFCQSIFVELSRIRIQFKTVLKLHFLITRSFRFFFNFSKRGLLWVLMTYNDTAEENIYSFFEV